MKQFYVICTLFTLLISMYAPLQSAEQHPAVIPIVNSMCPVLTDEAIDETLTVDYQGQRIGLCCRKCVRTFTADPEKYITALVTTPAPTVSHHSTPNEADRTSLALTSEEHTADHQHDNETSQLQHGGEELQHGGEEHQHGESFFSFIGGFHVLAIHFPIALLLTAALIGLANLYFKQSLLTSTALIQTHLGSISALVSTLLGWSTWMEARYPGSADILLWHQWLGTATCVLALAASTAAGFSSLQPLHPRLWLSLLALTALLVSITGHFGGTLIYG